MLPTLRHLWQGMAPTPIASMGPIRRYLSWENEQRCRGLLKASTNQYRQEEVSAAVLVSLCSVAGNPAFLYTLRSHTLTGVHKGDVRLPWEVKESLLLEVFKQAEKSSLREAAIAPCLLDPALSRQLGGKRDDSDQDVIATALRETSEELGLQLREDCIWGVMKPIPDRTKKLVAPVIANLGPLEHLILKPNPQEVEAVFTLSVPHLLQEENQGYTHFCHKGVYSYTLPIFLHGPHRVWGLTAILTELTLELLAPGKYHRRTHVLTRR